MDRPDLARMERAFISTHWRFTVDAPPFEGCGMIDLLRILLPHIPEESWEARIAWGGVYYNGAPLSQELLTFPCAIEYYEPKFPLERAAEFFPAFSPDWIIFEDEDLLASYKPAKLPCLPAREQTHYNLRTYLERYVGAQVHMPSRLDMSTSGIVVVSRSPRMHRALQQIFERRCIEKIYRLKVAGRPTWLEHSSHLRIAKHPSHPVLRAASEHEGRTAETAFTVLSHGVDASGPYSVIEARPRTGRTHQIRVHISALGHPIDGDNFYQGRPADTLHLVSYAVRFVHPLTSEELSLELPPRFRPEWLTA